LFSYLFLGSLPNPTSLSAKSELATAKPETPSKLTANNGETMDVENECGEGGLPLEKSDAKTLFGMISSNLATSSSEEEVEWQGGLQMAVENRGSNQCRVDEDNSSNVHVILDEDGDGAEVEAGRVVGARAQSKPFLGDANDSSGDLSPMVKKTVVVSPSVSAATVSFSKSNKNKEKESDGNSQKAMKAKPPKDEKGKKSTQTDSQSKAKSKTSLQVSEARKKQASNSDSPHVVDSSSSSEEESHGKEKKNGSSI
jgi:hypothetical protein